MVREYTYKSGVGGLGIFSWRTGVYIVHFFSLIGFSALVGSFGRF